ncbi:MAG: hypothetical protein LBM41_05100 [Ruminococcus sp.]|jgi:hypothetical protein|nr:hypothetical protein [Ruminococcus sp.]
MPETKPEALEKAVRKIKIIGISIFILIIVLFIGVRYLIKYIAPVEPDVGFHFEEKKITLLDYYDDPYSSLDSSVDFKWVMIDEDTFICRDDKTLIKIDAKKGQIVRRSKTFLEDESVSEIIVLGDGNIAVSVYKSIGEDNGYYYLRKFTPDLGIIGDTLIPEELGGLRFDAAYLDGIFYESQIDTENDVHLLYTYDENMNILSKETINIDFLQNYSRVGATAFISGDGKPAIYWTVWSTDPNDPKQTLTGSSGYHYRNYITSFEAKPSEIIRLPQRNEADNYFYAAAGDEEYPIYVDFVNTDLLYLVLFGEDIRGNGVMGVKWDGTAEKILATNDEDMINGSRPFYRTASLIFSSQTRNGNLYTLEYEYAETDDDGTKHGPRLVLRKLMKVYD